MTKHYSYGKSRNYADPEAQANIHWSLFGTEICQTPPPNPLRDYSNGAKPLEGQRCRLGQCANGLNCGQNNVCFYPYKVQPYQSCSQLPCGGNFVCSESLGYKCV